MQAAEIASKKKVSADAAREVLTEMFQSEEEATAEETKLEEVTNKQSLETKLGLVRPPWPRVPRRRVCLSML